MKKIAFLLTLALLCAALLAGCGCKHETWKDADCVTPKTCAECGETEGEALGHSWVDANCETPKTCSVCQKTEGSALGHAWTVATCETPKTCSACQKTEGEALGHAWVDATTEAPKTCASCQKTEGDRIITDPRFTTAACAPLFGSWEIVVPINGDMMEMPGFEGSLDLTLVLNFTNDGKMTISTYVTKPDDFDAALKAYMMEAVYAELEMAGISREDADAAMQQSAGLTVEGYVDAMMKIIDFSAMFEIFEFNGCYYVDGDKIYAAKTWDEEMDPVTFALAGSQLAIPELTAQLNMENGLFNKVVTQEG